MRDSVPSPRYSPVCNVLRQWKTSLIPTYRVYRLYDISTYNIVYYIYYKPILKVNVTINIKRLNIECAGCYTTKAHGSWFIPGHRCLIW